MALLKQPGAKTVIPESGRLRQEGCKFKASLDYIARVCQRLENQTRKRINREEDVAPSYKM